MTADELWEKYCDIVSSRNNIFMGKSGFLAALAERDAYVKKECARVCREASDLHHNGPEFMDGAEFCADEIERMEIK